ncbi:hypothetical protein JOC86_003572 [Bacillus pakistanensis]|uniref:Uncharacterized protein n=1 Tax=Rossellomorea pakistanensis TaxID=992288 RepID=A0ABS2NGT6_9BACI|nr:hypothetical protein [Bacillus pakistanensis]MBM7587020.1 hypothetical protein [Bacillus pakistanensis]
MLWSIIITISVLVVLGLAGALGRRAVHRNNEEQLEEMERVRNNHWPGV